MLQGWLTLFIIITLIALLISAYLTEEHPYMSIPFIFIGLIFSVLCTYGVWNVEWAVIQSDNTFVLESANYGEPYSYVFMFLFFVFILFFFRAAWSAWKQAKDTPGEFNYSDPTNYMR